MYTHYTCFKIIFSYFNKQQCFKLSLINKEIRQAYLDFMKTEFVEKAGVTTLYPHQKDIISWATGKLMKGDKHKLLCHAYMSAGKTLIGFEIALRYLKQHEDEVACIIVPGNVLGNWALEVKKHYPHLRNRKTNTILLENSKYKANKKYIDDAISNGELDKLKGKVIVTTPASSAEKVLKMAGLVIFDEAHRMVGRYLEMVENFFSEKNCVYLTATFGVELPITDTYMLDKTIRTRLPDISYDIHRNMNINDMLAFVTDVKERQSILVVSNENDADSIHDGVTNLKNDLLIDYRTKSIRNYSKFTTDGGMLFTTMRAISEGNNVNHAQTMIIVAPEKTVTNTIKQCIGRIYRESNVHDSIKIVFLLYSDYGKTWARCRLGLTKYSGFDVKPSERIVRIVTYLKSINYNIDDMSDDEVLAIFGVNTNKDILLDDIDIEPTTMNMKTFMRCVIA